VALSEALDVSLTMAIEIASDLPAFVVAVNSLMPTTIAKYHSNN